jgi:hypothetical protein
MMRRHAMRCAVVLLATCVVHALNVADIHIDKRVFWSMVALLAPPVSVEPLFGAPEWFAAGDAGENA